MRSAARWSRTLVDRAADLVTRQGGDHPLDMSPVAEANDIAVVAAPLRARGGLKSGIIAEALDQLRRIRKGGPSLDEGGVHVQRPSPAPVSRLTTSVVNAALTMFPRAAVGAFAPLRYWPRLRRTKGAQRGGRVLVL